MTYILKNSTDTFWGTKESQKVGKEAENEQRQASSCSHLDKIWIVTRESEWEKKNWHHTKKMHIIDFLEVFLFQVFWVFCILPTPYSLGLEKANILFLFCS